MVLVLLLVLVILSPVGIRGGLCPLARIGPKLIVKGDKKGQICEKLYLEAVWKEF